MAPAGLGAGAGSRFPHAASAAASSPRPTRLPCGQYVKTNVTARRAILTDLENGLARPAVVKDYVSWGAGPRASEYLILAAKADRLLRTIPVLAVTAYAGKGDEERIRQVGAQGYLAKPVSIGPFMAAVKGLVGQA